MLSWISSDFFSRSPLLIFPLIALGIFMLVFFAAAVRAWRTQDDTIDRLSRLPFDETEGDNHG